MPDRPYTALLVEDNPGDADLIAELLDDGTAPVVRLLHAARLHDAIAQVTEHEVDVVLLDLSLPDAQGMDTVRRMRESAPDVPVVVLTSLADEATALSAVHAGAQDYLLKGQDDGRVIRRAIRYAMERQALQRERTELLRREREARRAAEGARERADAARGDAERMEHRAHFLAAAGAELVAALDPEATLRALATVIVPALATRAATFLLRDDDSLAGIGRAGPPPTPEEDDALGPDAVGAWVRSALGDEGDEAVEQPRREQVTLLLRARGRPIAVLAAAREPGASWDEDDVRLLRDLCDRAALGVDNGQSFEAARRAVGARNQVLGVVSHDLRNPISAVIMCAESLTADPPPTPREVKRLGGLIRESARWMQRIIRDLLDVSAIDAGRLGIAPQAITAASVMEALVALHEPLARERGIALGWELPTDRAVPLVYADPDRLVQALGNMVSNAVKFSPRGSAVRLELTVSGGEIGFLVRDTGPGIAPDDLPRIFDRFWQAEETRLGGAGLGLAIARGIAEAHGGRITVDTALGAGSTFTLWLPALVTHDDADPPGERAAPAWSPGGLGHTPERKLAL